MLYVYGIIDGSEIRTTPPLGHHRSSVMALPVGGLAAAVSDATASDIVPTVENVWRHDRIVDALMARQAVLPMRFGSTACRDRLAAALERRRGTLRRMLDRVSGRVEIAVRVVSTLPESPVRSGTPDQRGEAWSSGTDYLRSRMARQGRSAPACTDGRAVAASILARLETMSADVVWGRGDARTLPVEASFLIARHGVGDFVDTAETLASRNPELAVNCTGPWAPYSFVTDAVTEA